MIERGKLRQAHKGKKEGVRGWGDSLNPVLSHVITNLGQGSQAFWEEEMVQLTKEDVSKSVFLKETLHFSSRKQVGHCDKLLQLKINQRLQMTWDWGSSWGSAPGWDDDDGRPSPSQEPSALQDHLSCHGARWIPEERTRNVLRNTANQVNKCVEGCRQWQDGEYD